MAKKGTGMKKNLFFCLVLHCTIFCMDKTKIVLPAPASGGSESDSSLDSDDENIVKKRSVEQLLERQELLEHKVDVVYSFLAKQGLEQHETFKKDTPGAETKQLISLSPRESNPAPSNLPELTLLQPQKMNLHETNDD